MAAVHAREAEVEVVSLGNRRESILPKALLRSSRSVLTGVLRADHGGLKLAMHNRTRFSTLRSAAKRESSRVKLLGAIDDIVTFHLVEGAQEKREGVWQLVMAPKGKKVEYQFKSASVFEAVGWLQSLRVLRGEKEIPVVAVLGETGVGKSLLASRLSGLKPNNRMFQVGDTVLSVTDTTDMYLTRWMGDPEQGEVIVIDTPGLSDSQGRDDNNVADMMRKLSQLGGVHTFAILFNSESPRLSNSLERMLQIFEGSFGENFWNHAVIVFTRWYTDSATMERRSKTPDKMRGDWNEVLLDRFPAIGRLRRRDKTLQCFFVDSAAKKKDEVQRANAEFGKFSVIARMHKLFDLRTELPDVAAVFEDGQVPEEVSALGEMLRHLHLVSKLPRLREEGVTDPEMLSALTDAQLRTHLGWTGDEIARLRGFSSPIDIDSPNYVVVSDFEQLGLPTEELKRLELSVRDLMKLSERQAKAKLKLNLKELPKFQQWREGVLKHQPVSDENVWVGSIVRRRENAWPYDEEGYPPQDHNGPGMVLNFLPLGGGSPVGETSPPARWTGHPKVFEPPAQAGWARIFWFTTGYSNTYRIGADEKFDLQYELAADAGIDSSDPAHPDKTTFLAQEFARRPTSADMRCTFGYPKGMQFPHWSKFDVRPDFCRAVGGFVPGDVVQMESDRELNSTCVGAGISQSGALTLYYRVQRQEIAGAGIFEPGTPLVLVDAARVAETMYDDMECHSDDGIENDALDEVDKNMQETFKYTVGVRFPDPANFDVRDEILLRFGFNLRHGEQLILKQPRKLFTVVGVSRHNGERPRFWMQEDGDPGASIWKALHEDLDTRFERTGRIVTLQERRPPTNNFNRPTDQQLRQLRLNLTYDFPRGVGTSTMARFDVTPQACVLLCGYVSGTVLTTSTGMELTVIGVCVQEETGLPNIWFHASGTAGAGILPDYYRYVDAGAFAVAPQTRDLDELREELMARQREQGGGGLLELLRRLGEMRGEEAQQPAGPPNPGSSRNLPTQGDDESGEGDDDFFAWLARETGNR